MARRGDPSFPLGRITLERGSRIGGGAYGVVHRAKWQGVDVAVKVLHEIFTDTQVVGEGGRQSKIREFEAEIERIRLLLHPNLIQFFGVGEVVENPALVMELMEGSLLERCVGGGREDNASLTRYLSDVASGLRHLHDRSLVHRDITLRNVLVGRGRAKLCDFGVSKVIDVDLAQQIRRATSQTQCPGTHLYMPPEALVDNPKYDQSLDIFSLGILSVCVFTGHEPSLALMQAARVEAVREGGRRTECAIPEHIRRAVDFGRLPDDHALKPILHRCAANDPAARPAAEEVQERFLEAADLATGVKAISTGTAASAASISPSSLPDFCRMQKAAGGKWIQRQPIPVQGEPDGSWKAAKLKDTWYIAASFKPDSVAVFSTKNFRSYQEINTDGVWWLCALAASEDELYLYASRPTDHARVIFKLVNGAFKEVSPPNPVHQDFPGMFVKGDNIVLVGGKDDKEENITTCSSFLVSTNQWVSSSDPNPHCPAPLPHAIQALRVICIDHKHYAVGGHVGSAITTPILMLCDSSDVASSRATWQPVTDLPHAYAVCGAVAGGDCVVMAGGNNGVGTGRSTATSCLSVPSGELVQLPDLPIGKQWPCLCLSGNELVCIGGIDKPSHWLSDVYVLTLPE